MHKATTLYAYIINFYRMDCQLHWTDGIYPKKPGVQPHPIWLADRYAQRWFENTELAYNKHDRDLANAGPISFVDLKELL